MYEIEMMEPDKENRYEKAIVDVNGWRFKLESFWRANRGFLSENEVCKVDHQNQLKLCLD